MNRSLINVIAGGTIGDAKKLKPEEVGTATLIDVQNTVEMINAAQGLSFGWLKCEQKVKLATNRKYKNCSLELSFF